MSDQTRTENAIELGKTYMLLDAANKREAALREELERLGIVLRASCPEHCRAESPIGTAQNYIGELEQERDALQQRLTVAEQRAGDLERMVAEIAAAPEYLYSSEIDAWEWFRWNSGYRPINKYHLCDVVLKDGRVLFDQSPHDFDWGADGGVLAARQRGERAALKPAEEGKGREQF